MTMMTTEEEEEEGKKIFFLTSLYRYQISIQRPGTEE
mgnify:CR=1 FL=1